AGITLRWPVLAAAIAGLLASGAAVTYVSMQVFRGAGQHRQDGAVSAKAPSSHAAPQPSVADRPSSAPRAPLRDVVVTLSPDAIKRAGIELVAAVRGSVGSSGVRIPGTVEAN